MKKALILLKDCLHELMIDMFRIIFIIMPASLLTAIVIQLIRESFK